MFGLFFYFEYAIISLSALANTFEYEKGHQRPGRRLMASTVTAQPVAMPLFLHKSILPTEK